MFQPAAFVFGTEPAHAPAVPAANVAIERLSRRLKTVTGLLVVGDPPAHRCQEIEYDVALSMNLWPAGFDHVPLGVQIEYADVRFGAVLDMVHQCVYPDLEQVVCRFIGRGQLVIDDAIVRRAAVVKDIIEDPCDVDRLTSRADLKGNVHAPSPIAE